MFDVCGENYLWRVKEGENLCTALLVVPFSMGVEGLQHIWIKPSLLRNNDKQSGHEQDGDNEEFLAEEWIQKEGDKQLNQTKAGTCQR